MRKEGPGCVGGCFLWIIGLAALGYAIENPAVGIGVAVVALLVGGIYYYQQQQRAAEVPTSTVLPPPLPPTSADEPQAGYSGWYPDPIGRARLRYWDGREWTDHISG